MRHIQAKLADELGQIVCDAEQIVRDFFPPRKQPKDSEKKEESLGKTQLSNAIDAIVQTKSIEVFVNWVRYQMARELEKEKGGGTPKDKFWTVKRDNEMFGTRVIAYAARLKDLYKDDQDEAIRQLTHFLGFLRRAFIARDLLDLILSREEGKKP